MSIVNENNQVTLPFKYQNQNWAFRPINNRIKDQELRLHGVALSSTGKELMKIVDIEPNPKYTTAFEEYLKSLDIQKIEVNVYHSDQPV